MSEKNQRAQALADDWQYWLTTRRFFAPPEAKNILAMMSDKTRPAKEPPNAGLSAEIAAFHIAVCGLPDKLGSAFIRVYCGWPNEPVKTLAFNAGIERPAYYERAHKGAAQALSAMRHILAMVDNLGLRESVYAEKRTKQHHTHEAVLVS